MLRRLREKPLRYWLISMAILAITIVGKPVIDERLRLADVRNYLFLLLTHSTTNPAIPRNVKLIWIGDDEYWGPALQHRSPTNRAYLASLIRAADIADASVIALDFDLRLSDPAAVPRPGDYGMIDQAYRAETDTLMHMIGDVAGRRRIVLAKTIDGPIDGPFRLIGDSYQAYGICTRMLGEGRWANPGTPEYPLSAAARRNISCGYIALMDDARRIAPPVRIVGGEPELDSFSLAVARADDPLASRHFGEEPIYASYIQESALLAPGTSLPAAAALGDGERTATLLHGHPVIIGAAWHLRAKGRGEGVDVHETPIGAVNGALIHANLIEALLSGRIFPAVSEHVILGIEIALGVAAAVMFAMMPSALLATVLLGLVMLLLLLVQWLWLQIFGGFLDLFAPILGLGIHAILDRVINSEET